MTFPRQFALALVATLAACAQIPAPEPQPVEPTRLRAHLEFLASDDLAGRGTGTAGYRGAADYVAAAFQELDLAPGGDPASYFQSVPLLEYRLAPGGAAARIDAAGESTGLDYPGQFVIFPDQQRARTEVTAEAVFVGYGIVAAEYDHDDYASVDVAGKIAVVLSGRPPQWPSEEGSHFADSRQKARYAEENGAVGLITLHTPRRDETVPWAVVQKYSGIPGMSWRQKDGTPDGYLPGLEGMAYFSPEAAARLFVAAPVDLDAVFEADSAGEPATGFPLGVNVTLAQQALFRELSSPNVIGVIEGSDPRLKHEYLVYSAHLDHLGTLTNEQGEEEIYNGALDNAAGVATLLETARVLAAERASLKRSVMFLVVTGEEKGMLGSSYFAANPTVPIDSIVANINLDMPLIIYPFKDVVAFGAEHSTLKAVVASAAQQAGVTLSPDPMPEQALFIRSDHYELVKRGVPAVFLITGFESSDPDIDGQAVFENHLRQHYHQPSDDLDLAIDYETGALFTEINVNIGREVCNAPQRPRWNDGDFFGRTFAGDGSADTAGGVQEGE